MQASASQAPLEVVQPVDAAPAAALNTSAAQQPAPQAERSALPRVQAYQLPLQDLMQVASGSGLQWVHSQPERVAQAQAAIAAEPRPAHVPRERPPVSQLDEGPLILVETRRDLRNMPLPFESGDAAR
jgi:ribonuclease E